MVRKRQNRLCDERGRRSIDGQEAWAMSRRAGYDALVGVGCVMEVGGSVRSRNLKSGVVSYGPESCET